MELDIQSLLQRQQNVLKNVIERNKPDLTKPKDALLANAVERKSDKVKFTYFFLKQNLIDGLNEVFESAEKEAPEIQDNYYIGIISDGDLRAEVLPIDKAVSAVEDVPEAEAEKFMRDSKVGFFSPENFRLKTPNESNYQNFQSKIQNYLNKSKGVIQYLRDHPEADVSLDDLRKGTF